MADCIPFYEPGGRLTAVTSGAVTGGRFVALSGDRQAAVTLNTSVTGGNYTVAHATTGVWALGVAERDAASGAKVTIIDAEGTVVPMLASSAMDEGAPVAAGANGTARVAIAGDVVLGRCMTTVADTGTAEVRLGCEGVWAT